MKCFIFRLFLVVAAALNPEFAPAGGGNLIGYEGMLLHAEPNIAEATGSGATTQPTPGAFESMQTMDELQTSIVLWLSSGFNLPVNFDHPEVKLVDRHSMIEVRASVLNLEEDKAKLRGAAVHGQSIVALYDDESRIIYLDQSWSALSPIDVSVLVHEMVHHLQNLGGVNYPCEAAREHPAYHAQKQWLEEAGISLEEALEIDAMTLLVLTKCWFGPP